MQDALKKMCEFMAQTGVALDDMDKEAERKNMSLGEQLK